MNSSRVPAGTTFAVVDIGSNTAKLSVYTCFPGHGPVALVHDADTVRIGYRVAETGRIADERLDRLIATLRNFEQIARDHRATSFTGVATEAFRIAANAEAALATIHTSTTWRIRIIDADEETRLTAAGARPWLVPGETSLVADIGGASSEMIAIDRNGAIVATASVPIGSGLLYDRAIAASPPPANAIERAREIALAAIDSAGIIATPADTLLLPGGTGQFLGMLVEQLSPATGFTPASLAPVHDWLATADADATMARLPVQRDRAQVLPAGLAVAEALVLRCRCRRLVAIPSGIRDGIAREMCPAG